MEREGRREPTLDRHKERVCQLRVASWRGGAKLEDEEITPDDDSRANPGSLVRFQCRACATRLTSVPPLLVDTHVLCGEQVWVPFSLLSPSPDKVVAGAGFDSNRVGMLTESRRFSITRLQKDLGYTPR